MANANGSSTVRRTLQFKFTLPAGNPSQLVPLMKAAWPFIEAFGGKRMRILQNVDDPARYLQEIEYETHEVDRAQSPAHRQRPAGAGLPSGLAIPARRRGRHRRLSGGGLTGTSAFLKRCVAP